MVELDNQKLCQEFNKSILSPNINKKKQNLVKSLQIWPIKHSISVQKQNALINNISSKDTIGELGEDVSNLEKEVFRVRKSKIKQSQTPEQMEKIKTKKLLKSAQRPKIRIVNDSFTESAKDSNLFKILGRIGCTEDETRISELDNNNDPSKSYFTPISPLGLMKNNIVSGRYARQNGLQTT